MRSNSKWELNSKQKPREQLDTRWATETIEPIWHFVAAFQNIAERQLSSTKNEVFLILKQNMKNQREMKEFVNHCAVIIQSRFRGYMQRKYYVKFLPLYRRFRLLLEGAVAGWRVRQILKTKNMRTARKKIK